jgi:enoyl-CoA hydratase
MFAREDRDDIAVVRMAYGKVSALDAAFCDALRRALEQIEHEPVRALVLTGTGAAFSAGVDLFQLLDGGADYVRRFLPILDSFLRALLTFPKPLVAAVNGHAIAGGCIMAAASDHRVMARGEGRIGVPELAVGVPFPRLPLEIIAARVSPTALRSLVYGGRTVRVDDALTVGFIDEIVEPDALLDRATAVARQFAAIPAEAFKLTKQALVEGILESVRRSAESNDAVVDAWYSPDVHAAIRRYLDQTISKTPR